MDLLSYRHQYTATYIPLLHVKTNSNGFATSSLPSTIAEPLSSDCLVAVSPIAEPLSSVSLVAVSPVAEPLSSQSVSLVAQEVMPRELRSAMNNNKKRKNYGKNSPTFILKDDRECYLLLYLCFFIVICYILKCIAHLRMPFIALFLFLYNFSCVEHII